MSDEYTLIAGRYHLGDMIGHGGMGDVFKGDDVYCNVDARHLSSKAPDIVDRFQREQLCGLNYPIS
jgi:hypothetical protein